MPTDMVLKLFISLLGASKVLNCTYRSENQFSQGACPWTPQIPQILMHMSVAEAVDDNVGWRGYSARAQFLS